MNDPFQQYRSNKQFDSDSESETEGPTRASTPKTASASTSAAINMAFHPDQIMAVVQAAVNHALQEAAADGQRREETITSDYSGTGQSSGGDTNRARPSSSPSD